MITLEEAKEELQSKLSEGTRCPCCQQYAKEYKRKITSSMAWGLILIYRYFRKEGDLRKWLHIENYFKSIPNLPSSVRGDISKLSFWGLIRRKEGERADGSKRVGYYKITERGVNFVEGKIRVSKFIYLYNNKVRGFGDEQVDLRDCLSKKFNYDELMNQTIDPSEPMLTEKITQGMQITYTRDGIFLVESDSGEIYKIKFIRGECSCPSRKRPCKHFLELETRLENEGVGINNLDQWKKEQGLE